jgi:hypothetical protein
MAKALRHRHEIMCQCNKGFSSPLTLPNGGGTMVEPGNTKEGSITILLTSCLTGLESAV